jgi:SAM-dependent methyltransferase
VTVLAVHAWRNNAELIADCARLGYLRADWRTLDPTYGRGGFWKLWRPDDLVAHDLKLDGVDFRALPHADASFDAVVLDPPYKLNGTPTAAVDERYGVDVVDTRRGRMQLIIDGIDELARVLRPAGYLLLKCQDQVNGGKVRWQTRVFADHAERKHGMRLVDMLHLLAYRPQPEGRRQQHARRNYSSLLILQAPKR